MRLFILICMIFVFTYGCSSVPLKIQNNAGITDPQAYEILGEGTGSARGIMLLNIIPIGQNSRFKDAYQNAIESKGGDELIDIEMTERWFWAYILNGYTTTIKGTVIKYNKKGSSLPLTLDPHR